MEKIMTNTLSHGTNFVIALGDHALGASTQLINQLYVAPISKINCSYCCSQ